MITCKYTDRKHYELKDFKVGQKVLINTWAEGNRIGFVEYVDSDIKNGSPGIEYRDAQGNGWWCYLDQVINILN